MARLWDVASGKEIRRFDHRHTNGVRSVAFSPDGKQVLTGSSDDTALLWDTASGKEIRSFEGHAAGIASVAFSPDGKHILTGSADCTSRIWDAATGKELCMLVSFTNGDWAVVDSAGRFDASNGGDVEGLHWVIGNEPIELVQLKERNYDPGLLAKKLGFNKEPLRRVEAFDNPKLFPEVKLTPPAPGQTRFDIRLTNRGGGIGRVVVKINGKEFSPDARGGAPDPNAATLSIPLDLANDPRLVRGKKNEIEVQAFNAEGYLSSRGLSITFDDPRETDVVEKPDVWALVVGISHYQGGKIDLHYAAKDADDFATGFQIAANRLFGSDKVHLTKLTSPPPDDPKQPDADHRPTHDNLLRALAELQDPKRVKPTDILVVYMAGHGVNRGGSDDSFCYLTCDAQSANLSDPEVRKEWTISDQELTEWIAKSPAQHQVMILDTCHSGKVVEDLTKPRDISSSQERALERLKDRTGLHILAGCAADSASYEASCYGQGVLTYSLLLGMRGGALKEDQFVDVGTLFNFAVDKVPALAGELGGIQRPVIASPKGSSFEIGQVTEEDKPRIPLQPVRPMVLRTIFQDEDYLDPLNLSEQMDELFRTVAARGNHPPLTFVDARKLPGAYRVAGGYRISAGKVTVTVRLAPAEEKGVAFEVRGETAKLCGPGSKNCRGNPETTSSADNRTVTGETRQANSLQWLLSAMSWRMIGTQMPALSSWPCTVDGECMLRLGPPGPTPVEPTLQRIGSSGWLPLYRARRARVGPRNPQLGESKNAEDRDAPIVLPNRSAFPAAVRRDPSLFRRSGLGAVRVPNRPGLRHVRFPRQRLPLVGRLAESRTAEELRRNRCAARHTTPDGDSFTVTPILMVHRRPWRQSRAYSASWEKRCFLATLISCASTQSYASQGLVLIEMSWDTTCDNPKIVDLDPLGANRLHRRRIGISFLLRLIRSCASWS